MSSGQAGIEWLMAVSEADAPDVILCDLKMPTIGGREVHDHLAAERPEFLSRLIFVTGDVVEASTAAFLARAGREVVEKPFTVAEIAAATAKVLGQAGPAKESASETDS
jgi:CheY-like chemotaxis protein